MSSQRKLCTLAGLLELRTAARKAGQKVVHCHGCFDIVHPGHIQYLEFARSQGDKLVVSISADPQVNKGADRPLIPQDLRAASLAALQCVDWVYINPHATAVELLEALRPDIYVKGKEYETNHDPRFLAERRMVESHGGRCVFSSGEVVFSSTALIDELELPELYTGAKIRRFRQQHGLTQRVVANLIDRFRGQKVVVIGDYILDRYHHCEPAGIAGEAPMMSLRLMKTREYDGGAAILALHTAAMGASPVLITSLADDEQSRQIALRLEADGIEMDALRNRRQIVTKNRYLADHAKLMKIDEGPGVPLDSQSERDVAERILAAAEGASAVIVADYGYGLVTAGLLERILPELRKTVGTITADVSGMRSNLLNFAGVDLLCPTEREARESLHDFSSSVNAVASGLLQRTGARGALITLGKQGLLAFEHAKDGNGADGFQRLRSDYLPSLATTSVDVLGCGDSLLAAATLTLAAGGGIQAAALVGSLAAAVEIGINGNLPVSAEQILGRLYQSDSDRGRDCDREVAATEDGVRQQEAA